MSLSWSVFLSYAQTRSHSEAAPPNLSSTSRSLIVVVWNGAEQENQLEPALSNRSSSYLVRHNSAAGV
jgi:hypothetical protein